MISASVTLDLRMRELYIYRKQNNIQRRFKKANFLVKNKDEKYKCENCGLVVLIEDPCGCETCELVCCGEPMKPVKEAKTKSPPVTAKK